MVYPPSFCNWMPVPCAIPWMLFQVSGTSLPVWLVEQCRPVRCPGCGTHVADNLYVFDHYDEVLSDIGKNLGLDFSRQTLTAGEIRHIMTFAKQSSWHSTIICCLIISCISLLFMELQPFFRPLGCESQDKNYGKIAIRWKLTGFLALLWYS